MTTYYAVLNDKGEMCSNAFGDDKKAWADLLHHQWFNQIDDLIAAKIEQGYRIAEVGIYNKATQVVVDKAAYDWACTVVYEDKTINWRHDMCKQFLSAGAMTEENQTAVGTIGELLAGDKT
jgi:hypothetical protein